jgi:hypothetical protein
MRKLMNIIVEKYKNYKNPRQWCEPQNSCMKQKKSDFPTELVHITGADFCNFCIFQQ